MDLLKGLLVKHVQKKKFNKQLIGTIIVQALRDFTGKKNVGGFVRHKILHIKTDDQALKIKLFSQKLPLIGYVNERLKELGYKERVKDVRFR